MTIEFAMAALKRDDSTVDVADLKEAKNIAFTAMRKMIPVSPVKDYMAGTWHYACGACGADMTNKHKYCAECGRKVKWG